MGQRKDIIRDNDVRGVNGDICEVTSCPTGGECPSKGGGSIGGEVT